MDTARETLEARISLLLGWEKRKRREATLTVALFYAFLAALAVPLFVSLSPGWAWAAPAAIFAVLTPCLLFTRRWRDRDTARALAALDRTLRLDERATTAWELLRRNETKAVALLVLRQASDMLAELRCAGALSALVEDWHAWLLPPLLALWLAMLHFDTRFELQGAAPRHCAFACTRSCASSRASSSRKRRANVCRRRWRPPASWKRSRNAASTPGPPTNSSRASSPAWARRWQRKGAAAGQAPFGKAESRRELDDLRAELEAARESFEAG